MLDSDIIKLRMQKIPPVKIAGGVAENVLELLEIAERLKHALQNIQIQNEIAKAREICDRVLTGEFYP